MGWHWEGPRIGEMSTRSLRRHSPRRLGWRPRGIRTLSSKPQPSSPMRLGTCFKVRNINAADLLFALPTPTWVAIRVGAAPRNATEKIPI